MPPLVDTLRDGLDNATAPFGGAGDTVADVVDPTSAADDGTETFIRAFPLTSPFARLRDAGDFWSGDASSPAPNVGLGLAVVRQFDDTEGGGVLDGDTLREQFGSGTPPGGSDDGGGGSALGKIALVLAGFLALIVAVSAFFSGLAEGVTG